MKTIATALAVFAATVTLAAQQNAACNFQDYTIPNADFTNLAGNNDNGHFVGTYSYQGQYRTFWFNGSRHDLAVSGASETEARDINNRDTVAGDYYDPSQHRQRGFLLNGPRLTRIDYPGANSTLASALNDSSVTVGEYFTSSTFHGFVFANGKYVSFDYPGAVGTWATGINNNNQISGTYRDGSGVNHGFLYSNGKFTPIDFPGADNTSALGIAPDGTVVGNYFKGGYGYGFLYQNGVYKNASFQNSQTTVPVGMNTNHLMTGGYVDISGRQHGFTATNCR
jgi:probable HAF family extracellular repeat protein